MYLNKIDKDKDQKAYLERLQEAHQRNIQEKLDMMF